MSDPLPLGNGPAELIGEIERVYEKRWAKSETQNLRVEDKDRREAANELLKSLLPPAMRAPRGELVNRIAVPELTTACEKWSWGDGNMLFIGPSSVGKTSAVAFLVHRLIRKGCVEAGLAWERAQGIVFAESRSLCARVREHGMGHGESEYLHEAKWATLLVLDDLAVDADAGIITDLMNHRYQHERRTVTTTGLSLLQLSNTFGQALVRRLCESAGQPSHVVFCKG